MKHQFPHVLYRQIRNVGNGSSQLEKVTSTTHKLETGVKVRTAASNELRKFSSTVYNSDLRKAKVEGLQKIMRVTDA